MTLIGLLGAGRKACPIRGQAYGSSPLVKPTIGDGHTDTFAPPKGIIVRFGERKTLLQTEGLTPVGVPSGPLLIELDERSDVGPEALDELASQTFRLAHANWRGFNARSQPVTLVYGELLARLVGYLEEVATWDPSLLRSELRERPWFL
jgi:hypothetical protein